MADFNPRAYPFLPTLLPNAKGFPLMDDEHHLATISWASEACERLEITLPEFEALTATILKMRTICAIDVNSKAIADFGNDMVAYCKDILGREGA